MCFWVISPSFGCSSTQMKDRYLKPLHTFHCNIRKKKASVQKSHLMQLELFYPIQQSTQQHLIMKAGAFTKLIKSRNSKLEVNKNASRITII